MSHVKLDARQLQQVLATSTGLPTLPGVAIQIISAVNDQESDVAAMVKVIQRDPALAAKMLRVANSPVYGSRRSVESLQQAVVRLGLKATQSLALSFSLVSALKMQSTGELDYASYWRRSLLSASAAKYIAERIMPRDAEAAFLASLMQDLGMMVLDRAQPELYRSLPGSQSDHRGVEAHELRCLRTSHPQIGSWMMKEWGLSPRMQMAVAYSHAPLSLPEGDHRFVRCVGLSSVVADTILDAGSDLTKVTALANSWLDLTEKDVAEIMHDLSFAVPALERLFDTRLVDQDKLAMLADLAREKLAALRNASAS